MPPLRQTVAGCHNVPAADLHFAQGKHYLRAETAFGPIFQIDAAAMSVDNIAGNMKPETVTAGF